MKALKISVTCSIGFALLLSVFSLVFYFGDWVRLAFVFCTGLFFGLVAAPEIEPKAFKMAWLYQLGSGMASGLLLSFAFQLSTEAMVLAATFGGLLGWSAPYWVKYAPIP